VLTYLAKRKHDSNGNNNIQINSRLNADFGKNTCFQCLSHYIALTTALLTYVTKRKHDSDGNNNIQINSDGNNSDGNNSEIILMEIILK
jgi:hypothetical protein